jgi:hypothetical protein
MRLASQRARMSGTPQAALAITLLVGLVGKLVSAPLPADAFTTTIEASSESSNNNVRAILLPGDKLIWDHDRVFLGAVFKRVLLRFDQSLSGLVQLCLQCGQLLLDNFDFLYLWPGAAWSFLSSAFVAPTLRSKRLISASNRPTNCSSHWQPVSTILVMLFLRVNS